MAYLTALPGDLKSYLLDFITSQGDLVSLGRTCSRWHEVASPLAYRNACFDVDRGSRVMMHMLSSTNRNIHHLRHLTIRKDLEESADKTQTDPNLNKAVHTFANLLPHDQLLSVR